LKASLNTLINIFLHNFLNKVCANFWNLFNVFLHSFVLISIDADIKSEISSTRWVLQTYPLSFHVEEASADSKLIQHGSLGGAYHCRGSNIHPSCKDYSTYHTNEMFKKIFRTEQEGGGGCLAYTPPT
jgi:hypothetical protein